MHKRTLQLLYFACFGKVANDASSIIPIIDHIYQTYKPFVIVTRKLQIKQTHKTRVIVNGSNDYFYSNHYQLLRVNHVAISMQALDYIHTTRNKHLTDDNRTIFLGKCVSQTRDVSTGRRVGEKVLFCSVDSTYFES